MKIYVEAITGLDRYKAQLALALLTWIESSPGREIVVWSGDEVTSQTLGSRYLDRSEIPFEPSGLNRGDQLVEQGEGAVVLTEFEEEVRLQTGNIWMAPRRFIEIMSGDADIDFECTGCGRFYSVLPFLETGVEVLCSTCAPQMQLFTEEVRDVAGV